jgi:5-methylcytosine-specific restriction endonuclease McrA
MREYRARWAAENPEKMRQYQTRYRAENSEKVRENNARYRAENSEKVRERNARWRAKNPEYSARWDAAHPERRREINTRYNAENAEKRREYGARYRAENSEKVRAKRASAEGRAANRASRRRRRERERATYCGCDTPENMHAVWILDDWQCAYCGADGTDIEHVVALDNGGWGCVSNFRIACKPCNSSKGTLPLAVFLGRLAARGVSVRPGATNSGLPCPAAAARMAARMLPAGSPTTSE